MTRSLRSSWTARSLILLALAAPACLSENEQLSTSEQHVIGGSEAIPGIWTSMVAIDRTLDPSGRPDVNGPFWCGGTYVAPGWVLTAAHCFDDPTPSRYQVIANRHNLHDAGGTVVALSRIIKHPSYDAVTQDHDIALVELASTPPLPLVTLAGRYEMNGVIPGESATVIGWGRTTEAGNPSPTLQQLDVDIIGVGDACEDATDYPAFGESITDNQICIGDLDGDHDTCKGDSGGPAFIQRGTEWVQLGITSWGRGCARENLPGVYTLVPNYRAWITQTTGRGRVSFLTGKYDLDIDTELTITSMLGSYWYFPSGAVGNFTIPYTRGDLPTGEVEYTRGDFNGDQRTDLVITTTAGSFLYQSNGDGTWTIPYVRHDLPLGSVRFTPGDFNGDRRTDLVVQTIGGSTWMFSNGNGTWTTPYVRNDLPLGEAAYTPGDFNRDGRTDLVVTTASGSYWYNSNGNGTWTIPYTRGDLPLGKVEYTPVDFSGDGKMDLVITTAGGSFFYMPSVANTWISAYERTDLPLGKVRYTVGDFDRNNTGDLVITTMGGSYWYFSNGNGTWTTPYNRADLPLGMVRFTTGDFDGDLRSDVITTTASGSYWHYSNGNGTWRTPYSRTDLQL